MLKKCLFLLRIRGIVHKHLFSHSEKLQRERSSERNLFIIYPPSVNSRCCAAHAWCLFLLPTVYTEEKRLLPLYCNAPGAMLLSKWLEIIALECIIQTWLPVISECWRLYAFVMKCFPATAKIVVYRCLGLYAPPSYHLQPLVLPTLYICRTILPQKL